jgi:hypothetical protein
MLLPDGEWEINANGFRGTLSLYIPGAPSASGNVFFGGKIIIGTVTNEITGFWNEGRQEIAFLRRTGYEWFEVYTGKLFTYFAETRPFNVEGNTVYTLAGELRIFSTVSDTPTWNGLVNPALLTPPGSSLPGLWCAQRRIHSG